MGTIFSARVVFLVAVNIIIVWKYDTDIKR